MKKLFVFVVVMATVLAFTSCGGEKPEITFPEGDLVIDLGDKEAALVGVTAKDKKDDLIEKVVVSGLDFVGIGELIYSATNDEGTTNEKREVTVKSGKLAGGYYARLAGGSTDISVTFTQSSNVVRLVMSGIVTNDLTFVGDGKTTTLGLLNSPISMTDEDGDKFDLTGELVYNLKADGTYDVSLFEFSMKYEDPALSEHNGTLSYTFKRK